MDITQALRITSVVDSIVLEFFHASFQVQKLDHRLRSFRSADSG